MFQWTKELPTVPGVYWWRKYPSWKGEIVLVEPMPKKEGVLMMRGWNLAMQKGEWGGPIPVPEDVEPECLKEKDVEHFMKDEQRNAQTVQILAIRAAIGQTPPLVDYSK